MIEMDVSSSVICSESVADSVARIVDGLRHSVGEGNSSCASSDSLSSLSFSSITGMVICGENKSKFIFSQRLKNKKIAFADGNNNKQQL